MSGRHAVVEHSAAGWTLRDLGSKNGVFVNGARVSEHVLEGGDVFAIGSTFLVFRHVEVEALADLDGAALDRVPAGVRTLHPGLDERFKRLERIVTTHAPVLVRGATGTGTELLGRAVHQLSGRGGDLVAVNCAAIPENLLASELFGVRRGAYSGAIADRPGLVRAADRGTLFLDEIAEMSMATQAVLLRVLQELDDLGIILAAVARQRRAAPTFTVDAAWRLFAYGWPQNIRQLHHVVAAAMALGGDTVDSEHLELPAAVASTPAAPAPEPPIRDHRRRPSVEQLRGLLDGDRPGCVRNPV